MTRPVRTEPSAARVVLSKIKMTTIEVCWSALGYAAGKVTGDRFRHYDLELDVSGREFTSHMKGLLFRNRYEDPEIRMIRRYLRDSGTVVELGSSLGITSAHIAALLPSGGRLLCVEANPRLVDGMQRRVAPHARHISLEIETMAVAGQIGTARLRITPTSPGSHLVTGPGEPDERNTVEVHTTTLRDLLTKHAIDEFDLVADIEGAEASILLDDPHSLSGCRRALFEFHDTVHDGQRLSVADFVDTTVALGFRILERHGRAVAFERE